MPTLESARYGPEHARASPLHPADMARASELGAYAPLRVAGDTVLFKPATDVLINGEVSPPAGKHSAWPIQITIKTATQLKQQTLLLHAQRQWRKSLIGGWQLVYDDPAHAKPVPLHYELAYGGSYRDKDEWHHHPSNPAGRGWLPSHRIDAHAYYDAAQIEIHGSPLTHINKAIAIPALGPIARTWDLRSQYAGSYDQAWEKQTPHAQLGRDYPHDFDLRFFQAAAPDWVFTPHWTGGEAIEILGLAEHPALYAQIPHWFPNLALQGTHSNKPHVSRMLLDTVEIDLDTQRLHLLWRSSLPQEQGWQYAVVAISRRRT